MTAPCKFCHDASHPIGEDGGCIDAHACRVRMHKHPPAHDPAPIPMLLWCPACGERHVDRGLFATRSHHTHACQSCGHVWRPAIVKTVGVQFLPGFKDEESVSTHLDGTRKDEKP